MQKYTLYDKTNKTESRIRFSTVVSTKKKSNNHDFDYFVYFGFCKPAGQQKVFATGLQRSVAETFYIVHRGLEQIVYLNLRVAAPADVFRFDFTDQGNPVASVINHRVFVFYLIKFRILNKNRLRPENDRGNTARVSFRVVRIYVELDFVFEPTSDKMERKGR